MKLIIELVPATAWNLNLRKHLGKTAWTKLSKQVREEAGNRCAICAGRTRRMDCHEVWEYDDAKHIQRLVGLQCLCTDCHRVKHFGLATMRGELRQAMDHLMKVNDIGRHEAMSYIDVVNKTWKERNEFDWTLDLSFVNDR